MTLNEQFMVEVSRIKEPELFLGLVRLFKIKLQTEEKDEQDHYKTKDFISLFDELMSCFSGAGRKRKKEVLKILRQANAAGGETDGDNPQNSEEAFSN